MVNDIKSKKKVKSVKSTVKTDIELDEVDDLATDIDIETDEKASGKITPQQIVAAVFTLFSGAGLFASFNLAVEALWLARAPETIFGCDLNAYVSCTQVAQSWQAELLHLPGGTVPNAILGMVAYSVFVTVGVSLFAKVKYPVWFSRAAMAGMVSSLGFAYWLLYQSAIEIGALCPWCILLMFSTTIMFASLLHHYAISNALGLSEQAAQKWKDFVSAKFQDLIFVAWILIIILLIILKYRGALFGL